MAEQLFQIGNTDFWVLVDTVKERIIETYKRSQIEADIKAIQETLKRYPDPDVVQTDLQDLIWLVDNAADAKKTNKDRTKVMLQSMWQAYQDKPEMYEVAELRNKLEQLQTLLTQMVV